jgi:hypothetical protein
MLLVVACRKDAAPTNEPVQPTGADPVADTTVPQADDGGGEASEPAAGGDECVSKCVASRQMQAISADAIQKECEADCASGNFK